MSENTPSSACFSPANNRRKIVYANIITRFKVLHGAVTVLGSIIKSSDQVYTLHVAPWACPVPIQEHRIQSGPQQEDELSNECLDFTFSGESKIRFFPVRTAFGDLLPQKCTGSLATLKADSCFQLFDGWRNVVNFAVQQSLRPSGTRVVISGAAGTGKSTLSIFMINSLLNLHEKLYLLDIDPGQPLIGPPGVVSLWEISKPLLCFGMAHSINPNRANSGIRAITRRPVDLSVDIDPIHYMSSVAECVANFIVESRTNPFPLVINSHGYDIGLGLQTIYATALMAGANLYLRVQPGVVFSPEDEKPKTSGDLLVELTDPFSNILSAFSVSSKEKAQLFTTLSHKELETAPKNSSIFVEIGGCVGDQRNRNTRNKQLRWLRLASHFDDSFCDAMHIPMVDEEEFFLRIQPVQTIVRTNLTHPPKRIEVDSSSLFFIIPFVDSDFLRLSKDPFKLDSITRKVHDGINSRLAILSKSSDYSRPVVARYGNISIYDRSFSVDFVSFASIQNVDVSTGTMTLMVPCGIQKEAFNEIQIPTHVSLQNIRMAPRSPMTNVFPGQSKAGAFKSSIQEFHSGMGKEYCASCFYIKGAGSV